MTATTDRTHALRVQFADPKAVSRPIITYINGDVSWLISLPRPASDKSTQGKAFYHAVIDPWFGQPSVFIAPMFLEMALGRDPGLPNRAAVDAAIAEIELAAGNSLVPTDEDPAVDAIFVMGSAEHFNQESLLQFSSSTPLFAIAAVASTAHSWGHFDTVVTMASCDPSKTPWADGHPGVPLPEWLTVFPPAVTRFNNFGLCLITSVNPAEKEMILMGPHGIGADEAFVHGFAQTVKMLALIAPLKDSYSFGIKTVLGVEDGLALARSTGARYYVRNGDFVSLKYKGIIGWTVNDVSHDIQWGVDQLKGRLAGKGVEEEPTLVEVENGGSYVVM
ncbi:uncharacterized protein L3040_001598 [Drepanopeziza brunnea f. sp. 'multigermtubi']|uniref:uncharacterized protein n=1 Tax=Drepanopeziza brunnea f. sp. 'multigermtubi' TaxID=698441 RepID=UPI002389941C|nr:hypothetical protein L3040_001598 [Drepanopeziza brunnea f. sp. 'multigermtubi']